MNAWDAAVSRANAVVPHMGTVADFTMPGTPGEWKALGALATKAAGGGGLSAAAIPTLGAIPRGVAETGESLGGDLYSALGRALRESDQRDMTVAQLRAYLKKSGVKKDEIDWSLEEHLEGMEPGDKLNLDDLQERVELTQVDEVVLGQAGPNMESRYAIPEVARLFQNATDENDLYLTLANDGDAYRALMREVPALDGNENWADIVFDDVFSQSKPPKHGRYGLHGGENYQETLISLRESGAQEAAEARARAFESEMREKYKDVLMEHEPAWEAMDADERAVSERLHRDTMHGFTGGHYGDTAPNVLVHVRHNDRTGPNGERILFIEEIQDDWAKAGRKEGYRSADTEGLTAKLVSDAYGGIYDIFDRNGIEVATRVGAHSPERAIAKFLRKGVPDRPFKSTGQELALKRMIAKAIREGYDSVAWTPGHVQVARYEDSLRQTVDSIQWEVTRARPWETGTDLDDAQDAMGDYISTNLDNTLIVEAVKDDATTMGMHVDPETGLVKTATADIPVDLSLIHI